MRFMTDLFKLLADGSRMRILLLLSRKELCVCQIMGVLGISQPLVSRNLSLLFKAGFLDDRREGKLIFYRIKKKLPRPQAAVMELLCEELRGNPVFKSDLISHSNCTEYQKKKGKCDMKTFLAYMQKKRSCKK
jgi:ArsR family transcriptional regulator, arsenate/arsenite/antimonite-responsive transcriptional repressor